MSALTAGEKAYLESGGADATALLAENPGAAPASPSAPETPVTPPSAAPAPSAEVPAAATPTPDPIEPGEEEIPAADGKTKRRMVDSRALKEARTKAKAAEEELARYRENYTRVDERLKMLSEAVSQPDPAVAAAAEPEDEAPIDPEQDIFGAYKQLAKKLERIEAGQSEMRTQTESERQTSQLVANYRQDAATFRQQTPDFSEAYNWLLAKREEQLRALGYGDNDIRSTLYNEEMSLAGRALGMRQSPSAHLYALAKSMGYQKASPVAAVAPAAAAAATPAAVAPQTPSVTAEIDRIKAGQASSRSLSVGGGAAGEEISLELLANMPQKEFERFMGMPGNREKVEAALGRRAA